MAYWRQQKWIKGQLVQGGAWYGTAVVLGQVGRNYVLAHRKQVLRVAPEQIRAATSEERTLLTSPDAELLGVKDLIDGGAFKSSQYIDLTQQSYPEASSSDRGGPSSSLARPESRTSSVLVPDLPAAGGESATASERDASRRSAPFPSGGEASGQTSESPAAYGPVRHRVVGKQEPDALWRPAGLRQDDFVDAMRSVVPSTSANLPSSAGGLTAQEADETTEVTSPKRSRSLSHADSDVGEPPAARVRLVSPESEALLVDSLPHDLSVEALIAQHMAKKSAKELHHSNNPEDLQKMVQLGKSKEWETIVAKGDVVRLHFGKRAAQIRSDRADRFIGSRFVITRKPVEEGSDVNPDDLSSFTVKARWCLQGHLDPDLLVKAQAGKLKSPTLSQLSRMTLMQIIVSFGWDLQLGDIKGAFLEAGVVDRAEPLYAQQPPGGIPGVPADAVIEIVGNLYGQNDAPAAWFSTFLQEAKLAGWSQSAFDPCLFYLRNDQNQLRGVMGVHVDDTAVGGEGPEFDLAISKLKTRFPYRKWRVNSGEFCGAFYTQCPETKCIRMSMKQYAQNLRHANIPRGTGPETLLEEHQIKQLRGINGALNWLATQSRPDLAAQTSMSQQCMPNPRIKDLRHANNTIRRARMFSDLEVVFQPIDPNGITLVCHSDAAWANLGNFTQAGFIIAFTSSGLQTGEPAPWCPVTWKSYKLPRAVSSTLAAESQAMSTATGTVEWLSVLLAELLDGPMEVRRCREALSRRPPILVTDCKSLFDHLDSPSAPTAIEDRRTSIDVTIIRDSVRSMKAYVRWVPTAHMLADALTKDQGDPQDMLRACLKSSTYQISPESVVLQRQAQERELRLKQRCQTSEFVSSEDVDQS